ncbi:cell wall hydrolase [Asticcacaulis machinosus]|uniref:Cell wall hydrolase n=1 Tax=Asticcacaulis machinosus TaxID=2984211 RepID=A0ABT5HHR1_9CAUL|nr:cell wall hydrolase [Asticcacaulis machinosus]MDC7675782.1 cell wall hydrolase [Asticcacaulis machinosus]
MVLKLNLRVPKMNLKDRTKARAMMAASSIGLLLGAAVGAAWLGGHMSRNSNVHFQAERLLDVADNGFADEHFLNMSAVAPVRATHNPIALSTDQASIDRSAMAIAMRYDPAVSPSQALRDRQSILLAQNLSSLRADPHRPQRQIRTRKQGGDDAQIVQASLGMGLSKEGLLGRPRSQAAAPFALEGRSRSDMDCLTQAVYHEARGETEAGQRAVAQVILNRVRHPAFPKTICNVVYQGAYHRTGCQFSFTCNGALGRRVENWAWKRAEKIASDALSGQVMASVGTSTHFHTTQVNPSWSGRMDRIATVGSHVFYQFKGARSQMARNNRGISPSAAPQLVKAPETEAVIEAPADDVTTVLNRQQAPEIRAMQVTDTLKGTPANELVSTLTKPAKAAPPEKTAPGNAS